MTTQESIELSSGEVLYPIMTMRGMRYLRAVDAAVLAIRESTPDYRAELADALYDNDEDDTIGNLAG